MRVVSNSQVPWALGNESLQFHDVLGFRNRSWLFPTW